jgi:hypothetical protein
VSSGSGDEDEITAMERLRNRVSPIPGSAIPAVFRTVLEEPVTPSEEDPDDLPYNVPVGDSPTETPTGHLFRKHRRRLPLLSSAKNRSSRSFDSGISCLLSSEPGSPSPTTMHSSGIQPPESPNISTNSRQSNYLSSPCASPGPRSPHRNVSNSASAVFRASPRPVFFAGTPAGARRFSEQTEFSFNRVSSYPNSTKSSPVPLRSSDSDSSPPTGPSPPPNGGQASPPGPSRASRRMLPETPKQPYNVWQQSRDSLDSGVYSRSTTCDSYPGRNPGSPVLSSTSPPALARHSWRRTGVARLPEPPVNQPYLELGSIR